MKSFDTGATKRPLINHRARVHSPSPPSDGGAGRGEEAPRVRVPAAAKHERGSAEFPLSPCPLPVANDGEREPRTGEESSPGIAAPNQATVESPRFSAIDPVRDFNLARPRPKQIGPLALRLLFGTLFVGLTSAATFPGIEDRPFDQETHRPLGLPPGVPAGELRAVTFVGREVWVASSAGIHVHDGGDWSQRHSGSTYALASDGTNVWAGSWDGLRCFTAHGCEPVTAVTGPIPAVWHDRRGVLALGQDTLYAFDGQRWTREAWNGSRAVRAVLRDRDGALWVATGRGVYYRDERRRKGWIQLHDELLSAETRALALAPDGRVWVGSTGGLDLCARGKRVASFSTAQGMPNPDTRALAIAHDGTVWAGTALGAVRRKDGRWSLRHSRRWLANDDVSALASSADGTAAIATAQGVSLIERRLLTLEQKAEHFLNVCLARHVRPPYLVEQCRLPLPGDVAHFEPRDDDNDGEYTSLYLAMESYRYAVTRDPQALENARRAFRALMFLQAVTGTKGFVARTVIPANWTSRNDPNETFTPERRVDRLVDDPRNKPVETRWRPSADGQWLWKGDTSSDEITGHFFGYYAFHEIAAEETDRAQIRAHVRKLMDELIDGGFTLRDLDGQPTRWGVWSPAKLNHDPDWRTERPINAFELLSFLRATHRITGDARYLGHYLELIAGHGYGEAARRPRALSPSERSHIDDSLLVEAIPAMMTDKDPKRRTILRDALNHWWPQLKLEHGPWFNFVWAVAAGSQHGDAFHLRECVEFLRDAPLDLVQWTVDNRTREDIRLVRRPILDELQTDRLLPPSERAVMRWDKNPWSAVGGDGGLTESSGVYWLLPYWLGRYHGFIRAPAEP